MKWKNKLVTLASGLSASGAVWGHSGHEALGDGVHIEYLLLIGVSIAIGLYQMMRQKKDRPRD
tara:strand:- start:382 stop:570 length:189 start_codon:yes stop_codon:yes gene_type:complete